MRFEQNSTTSATTPATTTSGSSAANATRAPTTPRITETTRKRSTCFRMGASGYACVDCGRRFGVVVARAIMQGDRVRCPGRAGAYFPPIVGRALRPLRLVSEVEHSFSKFLSARARNFLCIEIPSEGGPPRPNPEPPPRTTPRRAQRPPRRSRPSLPPPPALPPPGSPSGLPAPLHSH